MRIYFKIFGWSLIILSIVVYISLLIEAFKYFIEILGSFLTSVLFILTNVIGPVFYIIWNWIDDSFPTDYFFLWLGAIVLFKVGIIINGLASEE